MKKQEVSKHQKKPNNTTMKVYIFQLIFSIVFLGCNEVASELQPKNKKTNNCLIESPPPNLASFNLPQLKEIPLTLNNCPQSDTILAMLKKELKIKQDHILKISFFGSSNKIIVFSLLYLSDCGTQLIDGIYTDSFFKYTKSRENAGKFYINEGIECCSIYFQRYYDVSDSIKTKRTVNLSMSGSTVSIFIDDGMTYWK